MIICISEIWSQDSRAESYFHFFSLIHQVSLTRIFPNDFISNTYRRLYTFELCQLLHLDCLLIIFLKFLKQILRRAELWNIYKDGTQSSVLNGSLPA